MSAPDNNNSQDKHSPTDQIEQRLAKLRDETRPVFTQKEIEERLAKLTNRDPNWYSSSDPPIKIYQLISQRAAMTDTEKTDHLMGQLLSELAIDESYAKDGAAIDAEIERRLALLREGQAGTGANVQQAQHLNQPLTSYSSKPKGSRELIEEILNSPDMKMSSLSDLDDSEEDKADDNDDDYDETLDWCTTCNEDGTLRCLDCDEDVYCRECFAELHTDSDMRRHRTVPHQRRSSGGGGGKQAKKQAKKDKKKKS